MSLATYNVYPAPETPEMQGLWDGEIWQEAEPLPVDCFRPEGSDHRPRTQCKLLYDKKTIFGIFRVEDQYVRCVHTGFQVDVWKDSCVELFIQPNGCSGYFNFEFNCGGALLASYVTDPRRTDGYLRGFTALTKTENRQIQRYTSLPPVVEPEISTPCIWYLEFALPVKVLEFYAGDQWEIRGQVWRANLYKSGNETSHPHWASWQPLTERNFHDPASFGNLFFDSDTDKQRRRDEELMRY